MTFLEKWSEAAYTSTGFFWMALWAFILGYGSRRNENRKQARRDQECCIDDLF